MESPHCHLCHYSFNFISQNAGFRSFILLTFEYFFAFFSFSISVQRESTKQVIKKSCQTKNEFVSLNYKNKTQNFKRNFKINSNKPTTNICYSSISIYDLIETSAVFDRKKTERDANEKYLFLYFWQRALCRSSYKSRMQNTANAYRQNEITSNQVNNLIPHFCVDLIISAAVFIAVLTTNALN